MELEGNAMANVLDMQKIAETNPAVDADKLQRAREVQEVLERAGVARKADYRLAPPLGHAPAKPATSADGSIWLT
jgi:hypothetical protein